uniref:Alpha/beta-Hydrolases superfamily protein n=1 Tax=Cucumis melo TaxID=3656 RepID=A0A9I9CK63_CUCME
MIIIATIFAFALGIVGWIYVALKPPSPKICGTPNGPQVTSPRVKLNDGRHLAYKEFGVPREKAQYKIILSHGYNASKDMHIAVSQEFMEEVKAYMVIYDRAGYGESDPYPSRSVKTEAFDIEELADKLKLGSKFYTPRSFLDLEILKDVVNCPTNFKEKIRQQGDYECLHRDVLVSFGKWEFDPTELTNPSTESIRSVHMWQGGADRVIPIEFSRFVAQKLPWIQYHEVPNAGHLIVHEGESLKAIIRALIAE